MRSLDSLAPWDVHCGMGGAGRGAGTCRAHRGSMHLRATCLGARRTASPRPRGPVPVTIRSPSPPAAQAASARATCAGCCSGAPCTWGTPRWQRWRRRVSACAGFAAACRPWPSQLQPRSCTAQRHLPPLPHRIVCCLLALPAPQALLHRCRCCPHCFASCHPPLKPASIPRPLCSPHC